MYKINFITVIIKAVVSFISKSKIAIGMLKRKFIKALLKALSSSISKVKFSIDTKGFSEIAVIIILLEIILILHGGIIFPIIFA
ncbi:MAG: hypothetical protein AAF573_02575 [Bacteroidota bacterium]